MQFSGQVIAASFFLEKCGIWVFIIEVALSKCYNYGKINFILLREFRVNKFVLLLFFKTSRMYGKDAIWWWFGFFFLLKSVEFRCLKCGKIKFITGISLQPVIYIMPLCIHKN